MAITLDPDLLAALESSDLTEPAGSIWRDPHVQQNLLAAHLDESTPAATRSPAAVSRTLQLLAEGLPHGALILDLGCGPGLYDQRLGDLGYDVTGVDMNAASIAYARAHAAGPVRYVEGDYTRDMPAAPGGGFDLATLIYLDFGTHLPASQRLILRAVRDRLRPGGRMVLDYLDAGATRAHRPDRDWEVRVSGGFWAPGPYLLLSQTSVHAESLAQRIRYTLLTAADGPAEVRRFDVWEHCFTEGAIRAMFAEAGFSDVALLRGVLAGVDPQADDVVFAVVTA
jgi:SAM-dependent methyltransferase